MKILFIDDIRLPPFAAVFVQTTQDAIKEITQDKVWDEIWIDYDIGTLTIEPFVREMLQLGVRVERVFVHSTNPEGSLWVYHQLKNKYKVFWARLNGKEIVSIGEF